MSEQFKYKCVTCGQLHEGAPCIGFAAPDSFLKQPREVREQGKLSPDICQYRDGEGDHYFVRVNLEIPIIGFREGFLWGVWSSVSESNFRRYVDTWENPDPGDVYFGWLTNAIPGYDSTYALPGQIYVQPEGQRPLMMLHHGDHQLTLDSLNGMTPERAQQLAEPLLHPHVTPSHC